MPIEPARQDHADRSAGTIVEDPAVAIGILLAESDRQRRDWLHDVRWRRSPRDRRRIALYWCGILLLHLLAAAGLREAMRPRPLPAPDVARDDVVVQVHLIEPTPVETPPVTQELPPLVVEPARPSAAAVNSPAPARREPPSRPSAPPPRTVGADEAIVATPRLYNPDGSLRLDLAPRGAPARTVPTRPLADDIAAGKALMQRGHNIVRCRRTAFADAYRPDESAGDEVSRKYLSWIGLYNPHSAQKSAERRAEARGACDDAGF